MDIIETERLLIRRFRTTDYDDFRSYSIDPKVGPPAGWKPHHSEEETAKILSEFIVSPEVWAIVLKENLRVIGSISLHADKKRQNDSVRAMGYVLATPYWKLGFATEAAKAMLKYGFKDLNLTLISIAHYPFNEGSKRVIEKCGFIYEGTLRKSFVRFDGLVLDEVLYSITRDEFEYTEK